MSAVAACRAKLEAAKFDWALAFVCVDDESVFEFASLSLREAAEIVPPERKVFAPRLLRLVREVVQGEVTPGPEPEYVIPGEDYSRVALFAVAGAANSVITESLDSLGDAKLVPDTRFVSFYGSVLVDDDVPLLKRLLQHLADGGWVDLSHNRLTAASFDFVLELARDKRATVFVGGNPLASIESRVHFQKLFDAAVAEMKAFVKDAQSPTSTFGLLRRIIFVPVKEWLHAEGWKSILTDVTEVSDRADVRARELVFAGIVTAHQSYFSNVHFLMRGAASKWKSTTQK